MDRKKYYIVFAKDELPSQGQGPRGGQWTEKASENRASRKRADETVGMIRNHENLD